MAQITASKHGVARRYTRRTVLKAAAWVGVGAAAKKSGAVEVGARRTGFRLATFAVDVTPPIGHALLAGRVPPAAAVDDPLSACGFVLLGGGQPVVLVAVDWCEIRNDAHDRWRAVLAEAAGTVPQRVLVSSVHQHDAPLADLEAQRILAEHQRSGRVCDLDWHERAVQGVAAEVRGALTAARPITHLGLGKAQARELASNRRYIGPDHRPRHDRMSTTTDRYAREQPEGTIDPWLRTLSFWDGDQPVAAVSAYATHPQSFFGKGRVSCDFPGLARNRRQADDPGVRQIYLSGASGNVTVGKYNDGDPANRPRLADRLYQAMVAAWQGTRRHPLEQFQFRSAPLRLEPRETSGFTPEQLRRQLLHDDPRTHCLAALGLSWRKRVDAGHVLDVPALDFGVAQFVLLPAESYVEFQLFAQGLRPDSFVLVGGYGECAPGYIPIELAWAEEDTNLRTWCWVAPGAERAMHAAIEAAMRPNT